MTNGLRVHHGATSVYECGTNALSRSMAMVVTCVTWRVFELLHEYITSD